MNGKEVRNRGNRTIQKTGEEKGGAGASLKSNIKQHILGMEGEMSEVGIPPPHDLDNPHALVDSINNNICPIYTPRRCGIRRKSIGIW